MTTHIILTEDDTSGDTVVLVQRTALPQTISGLAAGPYTVRNTSAIVSGTVTDGETEAPTVIGSLPDITGTVGTAKTIATASVFSSPSTLVYSLMTAPPGATINSSTGVITYTPAAEGTASFVVRATVSGQPSLYASAGFSATISAAGGYVAPAVIGTLPDITGTVGSTKTIATASVFSSPETLVYSLMTAPPGATIDSSTGVITYTPDAEGTASFVVRATISGQPSLYASAGFSATISAAGGYVAPVASFSVPTSMIVAEDADYTYYELTSDGYLTFDLAGTADVELIGGGGGGGGAQNLFTPSGGGGASVIVTGLVSFVAGQTYSVTIGQGGGGGDHANSILSTVGGDTTLAGLTSPGGGYGGMPGAAVGGIGACTGGNAYSASMTRSAALANYGGYQGALASPDSKESGGGGGGGGEAVRSTGVGVLSTPGVGIVSAFLGDTVCSGGTTKLSSAGGGTLSNGDDGVNPGDGGGASIGAGTIGGAGAPGRVVIRIPKTFAAYSLTVEEPAIDGFGYALNASLTSALVPVAGTESSGEVGDIEVRVLDLADNVVVDWITAAVSDGTTISGAISVPGGMSSRVLEIRKAGRPGTTAKQTRGWYTMAVVVGYGQSNSAGALDVNELPNVVQADGTLIVDATETFALTAADFQEGTTRLNTSNGDGARTYVNHLSELLGVPVMYIGGGRGSTTLPDLLSGTVPFANLAAALTGLGISHIHSIVFNHGEATITPMSGFFVTEADYAAQLTSLRSDIAAYTGQTATDVPIIQTGLATYGDTILTDAAWTRAAIMQRDYLPANVVNYHYIGGASDFVRLDNYHGFGHSYGRRTRREAYYTAYLLGAVSNPGEFRVSSVDETSATVTTLTLAHGMGTGIELVTMTHRFDGGVVDTGTTGEVDDPAVASKATCFQISGDGGATWVTVAGADIALTDSTTITLTHVDVGTGGGRMLRYFYGYDPNGVIRDNSIYNWPLRIEDGLAAA